MEIVDDSPRSDLALQDQNRDQFPASILTRSPALQQVPAQITQSSTRLPNNSVSSYKYSSLCIEAGSRQCVGLAWSDSNRGCPVDDCQRWVPSGYARRNILW
jgi:hypothetical protein